MGKKDGVVSTNRICKSTKVQFLHFCTFGCYGWHCKTDDMQMVFTNTYILHLAGAAGMGKGWGNFAHRSLNTRAVACDKEELSNASLTGTSRMWKSVTMRTASKSAFLGGTAGNAKLPRHKFQICPHVFFAHFHTRTCIFALFHFWLSWLTQLAWLAPAEYAKVQSCSFAFLHVCTFPFWAVMADTTRLAGPSWICKSAKLQFCIFAFSLGRAGTAGNAKLQKC